MAETSKMVWRMVGLNVEFGTDGEYSYLRFKHDANYGPSSTGKSETVASTKGNVGIMPGKTPLKVGLNVYAPKMG